MDSRNLVIGADIGGSHITAALIDVNGRCLVEGTSVRNKVDSKGAAEDILSIWSRTLKEVALIGGYKVKNIGFAMPGPFDYEKGISLIQGLDKYESLYRFDVRGFFMKDMNCNEENLLFRNDAEAFLHGEMFCGAGMNLDKAMGLTLGTGFGSALSQGGITIDLSLGAVSFKDSIADDYFTTRWFVKRYKELTGIQVKDVKDMMKFVDRHIGLEIFDEYAANLSEFLQDPIRVHDVKYIVLGGNISLIHTYFIEKVRAQLLKYKLDIVFVLAKLKEDAALIGAAASFESITMEYNK